MGNLFYNVLGGVATQSIISTHNSNYFLFSPTIQPTWYWSADSSANTNHAWAFSYGSGSQASPEKTNTYYAWAVRTGGSELVPGVPIPPSVWLFGSGLLGLIGMARKKS
jgi:hypothetical protein